MPDSRCSAILAAERENAIVGLDLAMRITGWRHLVETQPRQQPDGAGVPRIDRREKLGHLKLFRDRRDRGPARFEGEAAAPVFGSQDKRKIPGARRVDRSL